ncbi:MAG: RNA pyrophosphohydrolase [Pseudomonadota bacterium]
MNAAGTHPSVVSAPDGYRPCVGIVLRCPAGVFAGERRGCPGAWQMPQGGIDLGESVREAALRELREETSVPSDAVKVVEETADWLSYDFPSEIQATRWGGRFRGQAQKWVLMEFLGAEHLIDLATDEPEFDAWQWMSPGALVAAIVDFKRPTYVEVFDALGLG